MDKQTEKALDSLSSEHNDARREPRFTYTTGKPPSVKVNLPSSLGMRALIPMKCELRDVSSKGACLIYSGNFFPSLNIGDEITIHFSKKLSRSAIVRWISPKLNDNTKAFGIELKTKLSTPEILTF